MATSNDVETARAIGELTGEITGMRREVGELKTATEANSTQSVEIRSDVRALTAQMSEMTNHCAETHDGLDIVANEALSTANEVKATIDGASKLIKGGASLAVAGGGVSIWAMLDKFGHWMSGK